MSQDADLSLTHHAVAVQGPGQQSQQVTIVERRDSARALRQNSTSRSHRAAVILPGVATPRRPVPSPLQTTHNYSGSRAISSPDFKAGPTIVSPRGTRFPVNPLEHHQNNIDASLNRSGDDSPSSTGRGRAATVTVNTAADQASGVADRAFDETKTVATRNALLEEAAKSRLENRKRPFATPIHSPSLGHSPPASTTTYPSKSPSLISAANKMAPPSQTATMTAAAAPNTTSGLSSSSTTTTTTTTTTTPATTAPNVYTPTTARADANNFVHRTASMDSTASSLSSSTSHIPRNPQSSSQETISPNDIAKVIQSNGSPEAAILRLLQEKQSVAAHTDQMWRIMEKQRTMIFGLKSDLERALKEKDKYRRKLKEHLALSAAGQSLVTALKESTSSARADSQSPTTTSISNSEQLPMGRKVSDATDISGLNDLASRSSTPQQLSQSPRIQDNAFAEVRDGRGFSDATADGQQGRQSHAPLSSSSLHQVTTTESHNSRNKQPSTPNLHSAPQSPHSHDEDANGEWENTTKLMASPQGFSSPKDKNTILARKAPPAPLQLSPQSFPGQSFLADQDSESDYDNENDDDNDSEDEARGRQKTRADDDRYRENLAMRGGESQDKGNAKSKSNSVPPIAFDPVNTRSGYMAASEIDRSSEPASIPRDTTQTMASLVSHLRTVSDVDPPASSARNVSIPAVMPSQGLPMSPRPGDRPINSPMPRAFRPPFSGMPMSPRDGGLPLSPRAPRAPLPLPTPTTATFRTANTARAEAYQQLNNPSGDRLAVPGKSSPDAEHPPSYHQTTDRLAVPGGASADAEHPPTYTLSRSPGEVYRGLVSEQYPGLLLPPNALPSIFIKVESSRLRPSRNSYMAPRPGEENPVFIIAIFARSDNTQLWRVEKTLAALSVFDQQIKASSGFRTRLPDRSLFTGHAPARIDARRLALGSYFHSLLDTPMNDQGATIVCGFLTADAFPAETNEPGQRPQEGAAQPVQQTQMSNGNPRKDGYLTKRGKNFGGWKARYFVLDGPQLKYFEAPGGALLGSIRLQHAQIGKQSTSPQTDEDIDNQYRHAFLMLEPKRKDSTSHVRHVLCAESDEERDAWVECLLLYVEDSSHTRKASNPLPTPRDMLAGGRSPLLQKSGNDMGRPASSGRGSSTQGSLRSVPYQATKAAEAPQMGSASMKGRDTPSPPVASSPITNEFDEEKAQQHPLISGPTNGTVISDVQSWGNKAVVQTPVKDKKRSIFGFGGGHTRGRASSDTAAVTPARQHATRPVFGVPLAEAVEYSAPIDVPVLLPAVAYRCIEYLRGSGATSEEGIFRLSGSSLVIKALRERFNVEGDIDLLTDEHRYDVHAVASLLKQFLRELPANILTRELQLDFLSIQELDEKAKIEVCNVLVNRLPPPNRELLEALTSFLRDIVDNEKVNKMSVRNVGIVFAPTLNIPATLISLFVTEHYKVFGPPVDISNIKINGHGTSPLPNDAIRSPRKQMFSDLPTPAYAQTSFTESQHQQAPAQRGAYDTGHAPVQQSYQGPGHIDGTYASLNGALAPSHRDGPSIVDARGNGPASKQSKRESTTFFMNPGSLGSSGDGSLAWLQEHEEGMGVKF